jgi:hypothetical protein
MRSPAGATVGAGDDDNMRSPFFRDDILASTRRSFKNKIYYNRRDTRAAPGCAGPPGGPAGLRLGLGQV